ncbi:hypothetical protein CLAFUW4_07212 [Fulvia fulva]|uniref:uncharacterized protein n=1 Tax=Passalora fulva TaxID=5499 RepID=UPI002852D2B3|nr:uncharacterized protein CLAFUR5_20233 [Fulvia fulva]KAK4621553.1 hypothetical protein CLAFUR4_07220 [Fulvia fulva]KAK4622644.1 hypothetical protein CLAFUR0_07217 [Fulvia fulva]WMI38939.1 hypothetical protein CLAFUR5_20233 [Fulvia fulva]WPV16352.1 hypothetical protein CLAFUW4_07212 [Fulvia fulva]WPV30647.1 hypothetical protein CLAFUW7_07213 [Fulvia fulva]
MAPRNLLDLPAELRNNIYTHLFSNEWLYIDPCVYTSAPRTCTCDQRHGTSILQTCRQLRREAMAVYFANVKVSFDVCRSIPPLGLINWLDDIGEENSKLIRRYRMRWNNYVDISLDLGRYAMGPSKPPVLNPRSGNHPSISNLKSTDTKSPYFLYRDPQDKAQPSTNPTRSIRTGEKHCITVQGTPVYGPEYWDRMGTADFSNTITWVLSQRMEEVLKDRSGLYLTKQDLVEFVIDADQHGSGLRWLWFW